MAANWRKIIDADGHIAEDSAAIIAHMPQAYRDKARLQPFSPFPPFDHLHAAHLVECRKAPLIETSGRKSG
jgi:hypothetical protein